MKQVAALVILLMAVTARASEGYHYHPQTSHTHAHAHKPDHKPAQYNYKWEVKDKTSRNHYGHEEHRDGVLTRGSYFIHLPDSRLMKVEYYVDEYGYHPTITYEGEAKYPTPSKSYSAPHPLIKSYSAPQPQTKIYTAPQPQTKIYTAPQPPTKIYSAPHSPPASYSAPSPSYHYSHPGK
ncbi:extensin-like [Penaeus japonicus]|uniref:extensin-like n=1 Tax=Penaeus japonicus TaxID=27405 RepID=UPI001C70D262|nr:extensin-like [Penaeus japonicus]